LKRGKVFIIGAGPGDYKLLTIKAVECIKKSEVIVYDRLIDSKVLGFAQEYAEFVYVGKQPEHHQVPQYEINRILLKYALEGKTVARVKGGDPFLFGRGGEECEFLHLNGIEFEVVPGVTSSIAVPAYAGIPVTHRDYASSLHIITGHNRTGKDGSLCDFETLSELEGTLVFLMGIKNMEEICQGLIKYGKASDTPVAIIENGTCPEQRVLTGTLLDIVETAELSAVKSPAVIVIGGVAKLSESLGWYGKGVLSGKRIVVTRPTGQSESLVKGLEESGAHVLEFPVIQLADVEEYGPLDNVICNLHKYTWMVFTSANGVNMFFKRLKKMRIDIRKLSGLKLAAVGAATADALLDIGIMADLVPQKYTAENLLEELLQYVTFMDKILLLNSELSGSELYDGLSARGILVDRIACYTMKETQLAKNDIIKQSELRLADYIVFSSPSAVKAFVNIIGTETLKKLSVGIVCVGPVTAGAAAEMGLEISGIADRYNDEGIIEKLIELTQQSV
jgi:uroporphyrinogen III methyltransferase/synthase